MLILRTQCIPILTYGASEWKCKNEQLRELGVSFNNTGKKIFGYRRFESVKSILRGFCELPLDLYTLLLLHDCLMSERSVVIVA